MQLSLVFILQQRSVLNNMMNLFKLKSTTVLGSIISLRVPLYTDRIIKIRTDFGLNSLVFLPVVCNTMNS